MRFFNTEGPIRIEDHYYLPPLQRWDLDEVLMLIEQKKYFLLHAPRQTGKTSCLLALMEHLNREGRYRAVYANLESAQAYREQVDKGMTVVVEQISRGMRDQLGDTEATTLALEVLKTSSGGLAVEEFLTRACAQAPKPLILLLDEVDALVGDTLISLLRQLRTGYPKRPATFPQTIILCGVRELRDYRIQAPSASESVTSGGSFNINAKSLRLGDFSAEETRILLLEHTRETGQSFTPEALDRIWKLTQGQPWLVNALAYRACFEISEGRDRTQPITLDHFEQAKESMIVERVPHLDQLAHKLQEPRLRRIIEPMLAGTHLDVVPEDDRQHLVDLGLLRRDGSSGLEVANPIYREVLTRALAGKPQDALSNRPSGDPHAQTPRR